MRKFIAWVGGLALLAVMMIAITSQGDGNSSSRATGLNSEPSPEAITDAKRALEAEKGVRGVYYSPEAPAQWQIGMENDGTSRTGYANYVCDVLKEKGASMPGTRVKIIDIANLLVAEKDRNQRGMGTVACDDYRVISEGDLQPVVTQ